MLPDEQQGVSGVDRDGVRVEFYMRPMHHPRRSQEEGRPIFEDVPFVQLEMPGDRYSILHHKATDEHKSRWPELWKAFEAGQRGMMTLEDGDMPLDQWAAITRSRVYELRAMGIHTLQQLAAVPDGNLAKLGTTARAERDDAKRALVGNSKADRERAKEMAALRDELENVKAQLANAIEQPRAA